MSTPGDAPSELERLLMALVEGGLSPAEQERLAALLRDDPALRQRYVDYMLVDALLQWEGPEPPRPAPARRSRRWWFAAAGAAALAAGVLLAVALWPRATPAPQPDYAAAAEPTDDSVAVLLQTSGAVWGESGVPTRPGAPLPPGRLRLKAGVAHIEFYCGATVILEGPADFRLVSRTRAYCTEGKLRATVPPQAEGFTIGTPALDVVDRGTEFGLRVGGGDKTEVHVFKGRVDLYDAGAEGRAPARRELTTGQGVRLDLDGAADSIRPDPAAFKTARQLEDQVAAEAVRRQRQWEETSEAWRKDPGLRVYYTFQDGRANDRTLTDHAGDRKAACDGAIVGCSWVTGRWPGKRGLEFKRVSDRVRIHVPGEFDALTLAARVRVDALPNRYSALLMTDGWDGGAPHWHIREDGKLSLGVGGVDGSPGAQYFTGTVFTPERIGQWTHLAVVYDRAGGLVTLYLDGRPVKRAALKLDTPLRIGDAEIGNWNTATRADKYPVRHLSGCMDEFMLFDRALGDAEVGRLYDEGRPAS